MFLGSNLNISYNVSTCLPLIKLSLNGLLVRLNIIHNCSNFKHGATTVFFLQNIHLTYINFCLDRWMWIYDKTFASVFPLLCKIIAPCLYHASKILLCKYICIWCHFVVRKKQKVKKAWTNPLYRMIIQMTRI